jgi:drug/metabolite transporter (DMT)-like permease
MFPAAMAVGLFALSSVAARRSIHHLGSNDASLVRILLATAFLGLYAHGWGGGFSGPALAWFLASGFVGFGICDTALFLALPRLGAQLASLMVQCLSVPIGLAVEWAWLGTSLRPTQLCAIAVILAGVTVALMPRRRRDGTEAAGGGHSGASTSAGRDPGESPGPAGSWSRDGASGGPGYGAMLLGVVAAAGQGMGAVLSRHGTLLSASAGHPVDGLTVAYQRIWAGVLFIVAWWWLQRVRAGGAAAREREPRMSSSRGREAAPWVVINALSGPTLGVACYQWALSRQPTGIVMAVAALTPLAVIPLSWALEGQRPRVPSVVGGCIGVAGVVWLALGA